MKLTISILFAVCAFAQPILKINAPAVVTAGTTVTAVVQLTGSQSNIAGLQDTFTITPVIPATVVADPGLSTKSQMCALSNSTTCILIGMVPAAVLVNGNYVVSTGVVFNSTPIPDGSVVQRLTFTIPSTATAGTQIQILPVNIVASDGAGNSVVIGGSPTTMVVSTPISQVQTALNTWAANPTTANFLALMQIQVATQQSVQSTSQAAIGK